MKKQKLYIGCKIIKAEPMTNRQFADYKQNPYDLSRPDLEGYLVIYPDGYESWSPKNVFEEAYREISEKEFNLMGFYSKVAKEFKKD